MSDKWYMTVSVIGVCACLTLLVFWVQHRQITLEVVPLQAELEHQRAAIAGLTVSRQLQDERLSALTTRVRAQEERPVREVIVREASRLTPVFSRGLVAK